VSGNKWIKLYSRWLYSPVHRSLTPQQLGIGALLLLAANEFGEEDEHGAIWLRDESGAAVGPDRVHSLVGARPRDGRSVALAMVRVGTMAIGPDGRLGFPNWRKWQENPSAQRMRKHRTSASPVTSRVTVEEEERREKEKYPPTPRRGEPPVTATAKQRAQLGADIVCQELGNGSVLPPEGLVPMRVTGRGRERLVELLMAGAKPQRILEAARLMARAIGDGRAKCESWSPFVLVQWYDMWAAGDVPEKHRVTGGRSGDWRQPEWVAPWAEESEDPGPEDNVIDFDTDAIFGRGK
jgi:hypothetical protein